MNLHDLVLSQTQDRWLPIIYKGKPHGDLHIRNFLFPLGFGFDAVWALGFVCWPLVLAFCLGFGLWPLGFGLWPLGFAVWL